MPNLVEIGPADLEKTIFKILSMYFRNYIPSKKGRALPLEKKPRIFITQECFVQSLVNTAQMVLEKKIFEFRQYIFAIS